MRKENNASFVLWLTGLPCSGKTTLARRVKEETEKQGVRAVHLDGDTLRSTLNTDLRFSPEDRKENLRRAAHLVSLFRENGNSVIASFVTPKEEYRHMVREIIGTCTFVYVRCRPEVCKERDVKGMYRKAKNGEIALFTGESDSFEEPACADIIVDTDNHTIEECVHQLLLRLSYMSQ